MIIPKSGLTTSLFLFFINELQEIEGFCRILYGYNSKSYCKYGGLYG